uniref:GUN4-like domain-containing protein n=1 Tax=Acrochaetium secundatum TaxID=209631 RepID=A0A4D6BMZ2_9FLOR|nr:hypothetical protein [Acrochaetium secundatum]QBX88339.1 hypothetical protein [Acrochaetium secundatum]
MTIKIHETDTQFDKLCVLLKSEQCNTNNSKFTLINKIASLNKNSLFKLLSLLLEKYSLKQKSIDLIDEYIYELLLNSKDTVIINLLNNNFPNGVILLKSELSIDYKPLQQLLRVGKFQEADQMTQCLLCTLSQISNDHSRSWLYFTDITSLPSTDLQTIDRLWQVHSLGLFGISRQRDIWIKNGSNWEKLWSKIGWTLNNSSKRYPQEFTWDITAPEGHLPLFNQLRGVQVLKALFTHPAWNE